MEETPKKTTPKVKKGRRKRWIWLAIGAAVFILVGGLTGTSFYFYQKYKKATDSFGATSQTEIKNITGAIGKFMELPDEEPTLATITDREKLKDFPFFTKAQNGDKVLIFSQSQKVILYRPGSGKIIEVVSLASQDGESAPAAGESANQPAAPEQTQPETQAQPAAEVQKNPVRVAIYNGTNIKGLAGKIEEKIVALSSIQIQVVDKTNAKGNYANTLIVDLSGGNGEALEKIKGAAGGEIGNFPAGEIKPDADILIIGGSLQ